MANLNTCIPKEIASKLKQQFKAKKPLTDIELRNKISELVKTKYGVELKPADAKRIIELNSEVVKTMKALGDNIGSLGHEKEMIAYFKAENAMNEYLKSLNPSSDLAVMTGTIGRGVMLTSIKSPIINIGSNIENSLVESLTRRLSTGQFTKTNSDLATSYFKMANKIYNETGVDISRMTDIGDLGIGGQRVLGKDTISAVGTGPIKKVGQWFQDKIFKQLMGKPDSLTANWNFADSTLLGATKMAKGDAKLARKFAEDAMLLNPKTVQGKAIRSQAVLDSQIATYTQRTRMSAISEGLRDLLNKGTGNIRLGDWLMPFVKTPANIISTSADYAGLGIFKGIYEIGNGIKNGTLKDPQVIKDISTNLVRGGLGMTGAWAISQMFQPDDFIGAYDPKRSQIEQLKNSNYNAFRVGDKWISTEWLGPLAIPFTAMMYAKKGKDYGDSMRKYGEGITSSLAQIPGVQTVVDLGKNLTSTSEKPLSEVGIDVAGQFTDQIASRLIPGIVTDISKATDKYQRETSGGILNATKGKIPGLRETLPIKTNILGEPMKTESPLSTILFGSRVKTENVTPVVKELDRVTLSQGKGSTFTDWNKTNSKEITQFKAKIGEEKFKQAKIDYGQELNKQLGGLFSNPRYQKMSDEDKLTQINKQDAQAKDKIFGQYHFNYREQKSKKQPNL